LQESNWRNPSSGSEMQDLRCQLANNIKKTIQQLDSAQKASLKKLFGKKFQC
jgi:hypothetical protein